MLSHPLLLLCKECSFHDLHLTNDFRRFEQESSASDWVHHSWTYSWLIPIIQRCFWKGVLRNVGYQCFIHIFTLSLGPWCWRSLWLTCVGAAVSALWCFSAVAGFIVWRGSWVQPPCGSCVRACLWVFCDSRCHHHLQGLWCRWCPVRAVVSSACMAYSPKSRTMYRMSLDCRSINDWGEICVIANLCKAAFRIKLGSRHFFIF